MDLDSILSEATHAARYFTDATGAALALWSQGVVICRARSGEAAPPLGAKLDVNSGVSGECLRSGRSKRCNDTLTDPLVDASVCQELGIRSLAAVPLRGERGVVGILEVFSDRPYAFSDAHITLLKQLAQIAVTGRAKSVPIASPPPLRTPVQADVAAPPARFEETQAAPRRGFWPLPISWPLGMKGEEGRPLRLAAAGLLLVIVAGLEASMYFHIVATTAAGQERLETPDFESLGDSLAGPLIRYIFTLVPMIAAFGWYGSKAAGAWYVGFITFVIDPSDILHYAGPAALLIAAVALWPLMTMIAAIGRSIIATYNPVIWVNTLRTFGIDYVIGVLLFYAILVAEVMVMPSIARSLTIPFVGLLIVTFVGYIPMALRARLLGAICQPYFDN